jgi:ribosomal-protein-alanine N-acetyltransferase
MMVNRMITFHPANPIYAEMLYEWRQDETMQKYNPLANTSVEALRERLANSTSEFMNFGQAQSYFWFIKFNNEFAGSVSCHNLNKTMLNAEIGYTVITSMRGNGIATEAVQWITKNIFEYTPILKLIAYVHEENLPSLKVLEKVGYQREGLLREHYMIDNKPVNEVMFGLLKSEFKQK